MSGRFDQALRDLTAWRVSRDAFLGSCAPTPGVASVVRSIDSALKSEVLEMRIRSVVAAQVAAEVANSAVAAGETETGRHLGDLDWWLTESTMRSLHAGLDGLAQLLNLAFDLGVSADDANMPQEVAKRLKARPELDPVTTAVHDLWASTECKELRAFVNHVKHAGCPVRGMLAGQSLHGFPRLTTVERFAFESTFHGPWSSADIEAIMDGYRGHVLEVAEVLAAQCHATSRGAAT